MVEIMVGVSTLALFAIIALPRTENLFANSAVRAARGEVTGKFQVAQLMATQGGRTAVVRVAGDRIWVEARPRMVPAVGSIADTLGPVVDVSRSHNVRMLATMDSVVYTPNGFAAAGGTVRFQRTGAVDSIVVNALGLVTR